MISCRLLMKVFQSTNSKTVSARTSALCSFRHFSSNPNEKLIEHHLNIFNGFNFHKPTVERMLQDSNWSSISPVELKTTVEVLQSYNFTVNDMTDVLTAAPETCSIEKNDLINVLEEWLTCQFRVEGLISLLCVHPMFLRIQRENICERIPTYLLIFNNSRGRLLRFLEVNPEVMVDNFEEVIEKYNYIRQKMELKPKELLNSRALCLPMMFIKTRHIFLDRSGQYNYRTKHQSPHEDLGNPTMSALFDTPDLIFAEKIARLTLLEYETFSSYFSQEEHEDDTEEPKYVR